MPEIVEMEICETCSIPCRIPRPFKVGVGLAGQRVRQQPRALVPPRQFIDDFEGSLGQRDVAGHSGLCRRDVPRLPFEIDVLPLRPKQFGLPCAGKEQEADNILELRVAGFARCLQQAFCIVGRKIFCPRIFEFAARNIADGVLIGTRDIPLPTEFE